METKSYTSAVVKDTIDEGLRSYMLKVYNYMTGGLCLTALTVYFLMRTGLITMLFSISEGAVMGLSVLGWATLIAPFVMVFMFRSAIRNGSLAKVQTIFWLFSTVMGAAIAPTMLLYTGTSIVRVFLITSATFGAMSLYGYTTKKDLTSMGSFLIMGLWGVIIASLVNLFMQSSTLYWVISYISVAIFVGLTAYDTQRIRSFYNSYDNEDILTRKAVSGALALYMDFINLFLDLLRIMGDRR